MTTSTPDYLYMLDEDLFRIGNASTPNLHNIRPRDMDTFAQKDIMMVISNGKGISLGNQEWIDRSKMSGWLWRIPKSTPLPRGLAVSPDQKSPQKGHFLLCPSETMPMARYYGLLVELAVLCEKVKKV